MKFLRTAGYIVLGVIAVALVAFLHYNLPRTEVVQITGTDTKRVDKRSGKTQGLEQGKSQGATQDVRYINTLTRKGKVLVLRNQDTGWGWPPYFKFDSADLTAEAQGMLTGGERSWVLAKYYGWRIQMFSKFPNIISLRKVPRDYSHFPLFNVVLVLLLAAGVLWVWIKIRRFRKKREARKAPG